MKHARNKQQTESGNSDGSASLRYSSTSSYDSTARGSGNSSTVSRHSIDDAHKSLNELSNQLSKLAEKWQVTNESPRTVAPGRIENNGSYNGKIGDDSPIQPLNKMSVARISSEGKLKVAPPLEKSTVREQQVVPEMYKAALRHDWVNVACRTLTHPAEANYVCPSDGTTVLHHAVISRASYAKCTSIDGQSIEALWNLEERKDDQVPANLDLIRAVVKLSPNALKQRCNKLGYTPLAYALLQPRVDNYETEAEELVRLLIDYQQDTLSVSTEAGQSPLEVHIASFSQVHGTLQFSTRDEAQARKTTSVLRILLEHGIDGGYEQQQQQLDTKHIGNALEVLYECNSSSILNAVECSSISSGRNNTLAMSDLNGWWVWHWIILLLEYSVVSVKGQSKQFSATHAAAALEHGCPVPLLMLLMRAFPIQTKIPMTGTNRYVLHSVCCWGGIEPSNDDAMNFARKQMALSTIAREFPAAAAVTDSGRTPLCLALQHRTLWNGGISNLYKAFPGALFLHDPQTGLYPFMTAATAAPQRTDTLVADGSNRDRDSYKDLSQLWTVFELLRAAPEVLWHCLDTAEESVSFLQFKREAQQQSLAQILQDWPDHESPFL